MFENITRQLRNELPESVVAVDSLTTNIIVHDGARGFVITRQALARFVRSRMIADAKKAFADLRAGFPCSDNGLKFHTIDEMRLQALQPCAFDEVG